MKKKKLICDFCGVEDTEKNPVIAGEKATICQSCAKSAYEIIEKHKNESLNGSSAEDIQNNDRIQNILTPKELKAILDEYVIGQEKAKKVLSVAVYNHYKRIFRQGESDDVTELTKSNVLLIGPTGSGKTLLAQTISKYLDVPLAIADATSLTEAGYVGDDVENVVTRLIQAADGDIKKAEQGIIFIDEIDKIARMSENRSITRDVSGEGVQQALLKIVEGSQVNVPPKGGRKHPGQDALQLDTTNVLFICGGAFDGIEKRIAQRLNTHTVGYRASRDVDELDKSNMLQYIKPQDLKSFGLIPEIIGRLPVLTYLKPLDKFALRNILTEPKNSIIKQYKKLMEMDGIDFKIQSDVYEYIVTKAIEFQLGARGLRTIVEAIMIDAMYDLPSKEEKEFILTLSYAKKQIENANFSNLREA